MWFRRLFASKPAVSTPRWGVLSTEDRWRLALKTYGFPYEIVPRDDAQARLAQACAAHPYESPVVMAPGAFWVKSVGMDSRIQDAHRALRSPPNAAAGRRILDGRAEDVLHFDDDDVVPYDELIDRGTSETGGPSGEWSTLEMAEEWGHADVAVVRIPTSNHVEVLQYLDWGGWNAVPTSRELVDIAQYWSERWDARLVALTSDTLEFVVERVPTSHKAAVALLREYLAFAPETLPMDRETLEDYAAGLRVEGTWFFWWD